MSQDRFLFLSLLGKIDSSYVEQSFQDWQHEEKKIFLRRYRNKIACAVLAIVLTAGCIFHTEVKAALQTVVTLISEMLGIEEDISSFTDIKNIPVTDNGITLTLEEVVLDKNQLLILVSQKFETEKEETDTELLENVKINGVKLDILKDYITDTTLDKPAHKYVLGYYLGDDIVLDDTLEIEAAFTVKRVDDGSKIGEYQYNFDASWKELEKETVRIPIEQNITISENVKFKLSTFTLNSIESNIVASCDDLPLGAEYYLKGQDDCGNKVVYRLISYENPEAVFVKETDSHISPNAIKLELQLYRHSLGELNDSSEDGEFIVEDYIDDAVSKMEPLGDSFVINIKDKANTKKEVKYSEP